MTDALVTRLRRNQTDVERLMWSNLRNRQLSGHKFRRQHRIGRYIADFACIEAGLVVEMDGGQHSGKDETDRTRHFADRGFVVIRFWNNEFIENRDGVLQAILEMVRLAPSPQPSPPKGGEGAVQVGAP